MPTNPFFQLFGRSPIRPLETHIDKVLACVGLLPSFFSSVMAEKWEEAESIQQQIVACEKEADLVKRELRLHLPKGLFLPVSRTDLIDMLRSQDRIANRARDIAGLIIGRQMRIPPEIADDLEHFVKRSVEATEQAHLAIHELDSLLETGFSNHEITIVENMLQKLDTIEHETDSIQINIRRALFKIEKNLSPVDVIFLYNVIDWIGSLADRAQKVGGQLQLLIAR